MTNNKQKRTAMELADSLTREIRYYCEENGIDTALGFELAKSIRRENDLVATYVDLGEDGYADWISDIITSHFEEEKEESVNMIKERKIGYVICPADMDVAGSQEINVNDSVKKALDYAFGMCMFVKYPDYAVHEVSYLVSDISFTGDLINIVRVTENTKINFLFFGTEYQSQQDLDKMIAEEETVTKQDTKILDWFELMTLSQLEAFKSSIEDDKDSPLDVAAIEKDYQEWLRVLPTMCQRIGADLHAIKDAVGIPNSLIK